MKASLLKKNQRLFVLSLLLLIGLGSLGLWAAHHFFLEQIKIEHLDRQKSLFFERLDKKKQVLHAATIALAHSSQLRQATAHKDRQTILNELAGLPLEFERWTGFLNYAFHITSPDGQSLYKSYEPNAYGQNISDDPMMQQAMNDLTKAAHQIDKGGFGNVFGVINIQPMFALNNPKELVGFITGSQGLKKLVDEFAADGAEYYVFERALSINQSPHSTEQPFVIDNSAYFKNRLFSKWLFYDAQIQHNLLQSRDGWYYQTLPIGNQLNELRAFHLIAVPQSTLNDQAWLKTQQVLWVFLLAFLIVFMGGIIQLKLLKNNVLKPMRSLNQAITQIIKTEKYNQLVPVIRADEIGQVSTQFNVLLKKTNDLIFDLNQQKIAIDQTLIISRANQFGTILYVNDNFCKISGYSRQELIGQPHSIVRHPNMPSEVFKQLWQTIQTQKIWRGEIQNRRKDGSNYYVTSYIIPILNAQGALVEYLSIREDITLVVELREGLHQAVIQAQNEKETAQKASKAKSDFLSSMSHEFRTPLNAIIGYAQLLALSDLPSTQQKQLATIGASGQHLLHLVNEILDLAKLETGQTSFYLEAVNTKEVIDEALNLVKLSAQQHGIQCELRPVAIKKPMGESIFVDRLRFKQVVLNLLNNAIKYNKPNGKIITTCQVLTNGHNVFWELSVQDTGVGISQAYLKQLFQPFNRLGHENSDIQGTGIGLSITKDLIEQMHGYITVNSTFGQGSEFKVGFPLYQGQVELVGLVSPNQLNTNTLVLDKNGSNTATLHASSQASMSLRVLYIDDDSFSMEVMANSIAALDDTELKIAPTIENGLEQAQKWQPHLIFIATCLSDIQHSALLNQLHAMPELSETQFCFIGSSDQIEHLKTNPLFDYACCLPKPLKLSELTAILRKPQ